jgi:IclR family KDG regulon transcriptional repressor
MEQLYRISVLEVAIQILETFLDGGADDQSLHTVTTRLGINKSRAFRILSTLQQHGLVEQDQETRDYRLGLKLIEFGERVRKRLDILHVAQPALDDLARETGETVFLGIAEGLEAVCIDKRESVHPIRLYAEVGRRAPLHAGGVPKVLLAYLVEHDARLLDQLPLRAMTPATITDRDALARNLAEIRAQGYVVTHDDLDWGASSIAAPIRAHGGRVIAAVSIAGPDERFRQDHEQRLVACVRAAASRISCGLGYTES